MSLPVARCEFEAAFSAPEQIATIGSGERAQGRPDAGFNPALRTLVITPDLDLKIRKALKRAARRLAFRALLRYLRFQIEYLALKSRLAVLRVLRKFAGKLAELPFDRHF